MPGGPRYDIAGTETATDYNAFISYSHAADEQLAPALQHGLERFAKPWNRRRALRIFRDDSGLSVNAALWPSIVDALDGSEYFILMASPEAAQSEWVNREVGRWRELGRAGSILPVLTEGEWVWDTETNDFDWDKSSAVPPNLGGVFTDEPRHLDLRWARGPVPANKLDLHNGVFRSAVADLAAPLHGKPKDELEGQDLREYNKARRFRRLVSASLAVLAVALGIAAFLAVGNAHDARRQETLAQENEAVAKQNEAEAVAQAAIATSRQLAAQSVALAPGELDLALLLALAARQVDDNAETQGALLTALEANPQLVAYVPPADGFATAISGGSASGRLAVGDSAGSVEILDFDNLAEIGHFQVPTAEGVTALAFDGADRFVAAGTENGDVSVWDVGTMEVVADVRNQQPAAPVAFVAFDPSASQLAISWDEPEPGDTGFAPQRLEVWTLAASALSRRVALEPPTSVEIMGFDGPDSLMVFGFAEMKQFDLATGAVTETWRLENGGAQSGRSAHTPGGEVGAWSTLDRGNIGTYHPGPASDEPRAAASITVRAGAIDLLKWKASDATLGVAQEGEISLWTLDGQRLATMGGAESAITDFAFAANSDRMASLGNGKVQVWDPGTPSRLGRVAPVSKIEGLPNVVKRVVGLGFSPDGSKLAWVVDPDGFYRTGDNIVERAGTNVAVWDLATNGLGTVAANSTPLALGFVDLDTIATSDGPGQDERLVVETWKAADGSPSSKSAECVPPPTGSWMMAPAEPIDRASSSVHFERCNAGALAVVEIALPADSPGGASGDVLAALSSSGSAIAILDRSNSRMTVGSVNDEGRIESRHDLALTSPVGFSSPQWPFLTPDGTTAMVIYGQADPTGSTAGRSTATVWDVASGELRGSIGPAAIDDIAFSADGKRFAVALSSGAIEIRDGVTLQLMTVLPGAGDSRIRHVVFSPDGSRLAETSTGGGLVLWDLDVAAWEERACGIAARGVSADERTTYFGSSLVPDVECSGSSPEHAAVLAPPAVASVSTAQPTEAVPETSTTAVTAAFANPREECFRFILDPLSPEIRFQAGASSGVVEGTIAERNAAQYRLAAAEGQVIDIGVDGPFLVCLESLDGFLVAEMGGLQTPLPSTQEYFITLVAVDQVGPYHLEVTLP